MQTFAYARPRRIEDAVALMGREGAAVLAGGTDLLSLMKDSIETPKLLVNIKDIEKLRTIEDRVDDLAIGAAVTLAEIEVHPAIRGLRALRNAIAGIASPQIRSMGTIGGELCQRPRCWYYRSGLGLLPELKDSRGESQAAGGSRVEQRDSRYHSIFGDGPARFVSPSSLAPALIALEARLVVDGPGGERTIPAEELYRSPRKPGEREHALAQQELIREILLPDRASERRSATYEVRPRQALDWPLAAAAVSFLLDGGTVRSPRIVLGHVAPTPWRCSKAEQLLEGQKLDAQMEPMVEQVAAAAVDGARPLPDNGYKVQLARVAVKRAILEAFAEKVERNG